MDLPIALDVALKALLASHAVCSWKIAAERQNLTVIVRLRPVHVPSVFNNGVPHVNTVAYRRKSPSQMQRDRQRMQTFRQRECAEHVNVPGTNLLASDQSTVLVNERSVIRSERQSDTASIVDDNDRDSGSRANDETGSLASAASVAGTGVTQEGGSDQEVSEGESDADSAESVAAALSSPLTGSRTSAGVEVSSEGTARNEDTPASRADQRTEDGAHGGVESQVDTGSLSLQKYLCQETAPGSQPGKRTREGEEKREKKISDISVRSINLHDSGVEILHVRDESNVTLDTNEVNAIGGQSGGLGEKGRGGGMREVSPKAGDKSDSSKHQSVYHRLESTRCDGNLRFPHSQTDISDIHPSPMSYEEQYHEYYEQQNKLWYDHAMAVQRVTMPAYGTYPPYPYPLPMMPTMPPVSMGWGEGLCVGDPSLEVSEGHDQCIKTDCVSDFEGCETFGKKEREIAKEMNEERDERCTEGRKMWSSVNKKGFGNNERYGRERRDTYRRDDDRYRGGRGYRDSERFRGRGGSTRWARDYQDRGARY